MATRCTINKLKLEQKSMVDTIANTRFFTYYLYFGVKVTQNIAQYLLHNMTYAPVKLLFSMIKEKHLQENTLNDLDLGVTQNVVQCPSNHMTYVPRKFEAAMSNSLEGDAFTRKYII